MAKILLESDVKTIGGINKPYTNYLLCTKKRAEALNCNVTSPTSATDYQLIYEVSKAHNYTLQGPNSITWRGGSVTATIGIVSSKDGVWLQPSIQSKSSFISSVTISQTSGINGTVTIRYNTSQAQDGQITLVQTESGLTHKVYIYKEQPSTANLLYVNILWNGSPITFTSNRVVTATVYLMDNNGTLFTGSVQFNYGSSMGTLVSGSKAIGYINNTMSTSIPITKVRIVLTDGISVNARYDRTLTLSRQIFSNGSLYLSLYNSYMVQNQ